MRTRTRQFGAVASLTFLMMLGPHAQAEQAKSADAFVDSIGVNTHWNYPDTPYGSQYEKVKSLLVQAGIRHVRGELRRAPDLARVGIKTMVGLSPGHNENGDIHTIEKFRDQIKAANKDIPCVDWVEGPNEPDLFWQKTDNGDKNGYGAVTYKSQGYAQGDKGIIQGVIAFQRDLYTVFKSDPATAGLKIVGPAMGKTYGYDTGNPLGKGALTDFVDYGNFHPYPTGGNPFSQHFPYDTIDWYVGHGTHPSANMDEFHFAFDIGAPPFAPKPMACSESGYSTYTNGETEAVQAKYIPRLFCEYFNRGIARTYLYEFLDVFDNKGDRDSNFGLVHHDLTPKPSYTAVKNLISLLSDKAAPATFTPGTLDLTFKVDPVLNYREPDSGQTVNYDRTQYVHHLLLQKASGDYYLLLWHEIADSDASSPPDKPHREIIPPPMPTTITLPASIKTATVYLPNNGTDGTPATITNGQLSLQVPDRVMVVKLSRRIASAKASRPAPKTAPRRPIRRRGSGRITVSTPRIGAA